MSDPKSVQRADRLSDLSYNVMSMEKRGDCDSRKLIIFTQKYLNEDERTYEQLARNLRHLVNPGLYTARSAQLFAAALEDLGYTGGMAELLQDKGHYLIAGHGTSSMDAIRGIMKDGFDPKRRSGQVYGPGEYFDTGNGEIAKNYTRCVCTEEVKSTGYSRSHSPFGYIIGTLIVTRGKGGSSLPQVLPPVTFHDYHSFDGSAGVVDNPVDGLKAYCLPLGLLPFFGNTAAIDDLCGTIGAVSSMSEKLQKDVLEAVISEGAGNSEQQKEEVREYVDRGGVLRLPTNYRGWRQIPKQELLKEVPCLGFMDGTCNNPNCQRSHQPVLLQIARQQQYGQFNPNRHHATGAFLYKWQYFDDKKSGGVDGGYHDYDAPASAILERAYCPTALSQTCQVHSGEWDYEVTFAAGQQRNTTFGTIRKIRRVRSTATTPTVVSTTTTYTRISSSSSSGDNETCRIC